MNNKKTDALYPTVRQVISVMILTFFVMLLFSAVAGGWESKYYFIGSRVMFVLPMLIFLFREKFSFALLLRLRQVSPRILGISLVIGVCLSIVGEEFDRIMNLIIPLPEELKALLETGMSADSPFDWLVLIFGAIILTALLEEFLFRCFLQSTLESQLDVTRAVLATAFVFSFFYANPISIVQIVLVGVVLGVLAWKSDSFLPSAAAHTMINAAGIAMTSTALSEAPLLNWNGHIHPLLLLPVCAILFLTVLLFYKFVEEDLEISTYFNEPL